MNSRELAQSSVRIAYTLDAIPTSAGVQRSTTRTVTYTVTGGT
jgi:hypothetical protein